MALWVMSCRVILREARLHTKLRPDRSPSRQLRAMSDISQCRKRGGMSVLSWSGAMR